MITRAAPRPLGDDVRVANRPERYRVPSDVPADGRFGVRGRHPERARGERCGRQGSRQVGMGSHCVGLPPEQLISVCLRFVAMATRLDGQADRLPRSAHLTVTGEAGCADVLDPAGWFGGVEYVWFTPGGAAA
jgi:hypothetical protein